MLTDEAMLRLFADDATCNVSVMRMVSLTTLTVHNPGIQSEADITESVLAKVDI